MLTAYQDEHEPCFSAILKLISLHCKVKSGDTFSSAVLPYQNLLRRKSEKNIEVEIHVSFALDRLRIHLT